MSAITFADARHAAARAWVDDVASLTNPDRVEWCDGSQAEWDRLTDEFLCYHAGDYFAEALDVDTEEWLAELPLIKEWFDKIGDRLPTQLRTELTDLEARLRNS